MVIAHGWVASPAEQHKVVLAHEVGHTYCKHDWKIGLPGAYLLTLFRVLYASQRFWQQHPAMFPLDVSLLMSAAIWLTVAGIFELTPKTKIQAIPSLHACSYAYTCNNRQYSLCREADLRRVELRMKPCR